MGGCVLSGGSGRGWVQRSCVGTEPGLASTSQGTSGSLGWYRWPAEVTRVFRRLRGLLRLSQDPLERTCRSSSSAGAGTAQGVSVRLQGCGRGREERAPRLGCRAPHYGQGSAIPVRWSYTRELPRVLSGMLAVPCGMGPSPVPALERRCPRRAAPWSLGRARPALHKRRSAADAAGGLQGESQPLGTGGREEGSGAGSCEREGAPGPGRDAGRGCGGSALPAALGEPRGSGAAWRGRRQCRVFISKDVSSQLTRPYFNTADLRVLAVVSLPMRSAEPEPRSWPQLRGGPGCSLPLGPGTAAHGRSHRCHLSCLQSIHARP